MIEKNCFVNAFVSLLKKEFKSRLWFVGLQGSYANDEATESSDIDMVVILKELNCNDIKLYNTLLDQLPQRQLMCGFICGKSELLKWNAAELFQFYYDTKPVIGNLDELLLFINDNTINQSIKAETCSIYHSCVHNMLYEKSEEILKGLYKSAAFVIQAICFINTGEYIGNKTELFKYASAQNKEVLMNLFFLKNNEDIDFDEFSETLFKWSKKIIKQY